MPLRKNRFTPQMHIWLLRAAILTVGLIAFTLSLTLRTEQNILMYFAMVNNIWLGPAGAIMLGGLYWKRGTTRAAMLTLILGTLMGLSFFGLEQYFSHVLSRPFPISGQWLFFITICFSASVYVAVSLIENRPAFNMDLLLHRGAYRIDGQQAEEQNPISRWQRAFGITPMFTRGDRVTAYLVVGHFMALLGIFIAGILYGNIATVSQDDWARFWHGYLYCVLAVLVVSTVWLGIGGIRDLLRLIKGLRESTTDVHDDGWVRQDHAEKRQS
jgi:solute:Na+ symporter, SSS family